MATVRVKAGERLVWTSEDFGPCHNPVNGLPRTILVMSSEPGASAPFIQSLFIEQHGARNLGYPLTTNQAQNQIRLQIDPYTRAIRVHSSIPAIVDTDISFSIQRTERRSDGFTPLSGAEGFDSPGPRPNTGDEKGLAERPPWRKRLLIASGEDIDWGIRRRELGDGDLLRLTSPQAGAAFLSSCRLVQLEAWRILSSRGLSPDGYEGRVFEIDLHPNTDRICLSSPKLSTAESTEIYVERPRARHRSSQIQHLPSSPERCSRPSTAPPSRRRSPTCPTHRRNRSLAGRHQMGTTGQ